MSSELSARANKSENTRDISLICETFSLFEARQRTSDRYVLQNYEHQQCQYRRANFAKMQQTSQEKTILKKPVRQSAKSAA